MAHCGCLWSRTFSRAAILLTKTGTVSQLRRVPARTLSTTGRWLASENKEGEGAGADFQHSQQFQEDPTQSQSQTFNTAQFTVDDDQHEHDIKQRILAASLVHVDRYGWTRKAIEAGAQSEGLPNIAQGMFPRGGVDLVFYFVNQCNTELGQILKDQEEATGKVERDDVGLREFTRDAFQTRLQMIVPYLDSWPQAMAIQALPSNAVESWKHLLNLSDTVWFHAGDKSVDFQWYTRRAATAGIYKSSEIYMLQDKSHDQQDTWDFLDRRLKDYESSLNCGSKVQEGLGALKEGLQASCTLGRNILGLNSRDR